MTQRTRERRGSPRIVAKLAMQVAGGEDGSVLTTESVNLSSSGIQFLSRAFLSPLTKVMLTLLLPPFGRTLRRERMVRCEGIVVRCDELEGSRARPRYELACYFIESPDEDRRLIEQYVAWRSLRRVQAVPAPRAVASPPARRKAGSAAPKAAAAKPRRRTASS
ncbi:MAG TPA: PilZ domain-containing protein [Candidatus Eisenbacteria bacterium]|nr:PilZ domain-containing protein [Candidatus Eisenbacteria bacterium]